MKFYKSLDRPSVLFGIRGSFFFILLIAAGVCILAGLVVGSVFGGLWGFILSVLLIAACYGVVLYLQSRLSHRDLNRFMAGRHIDDTMLMYPVQSFIEVEDADTEKEE